MLGLSHWRKHDQQYDYCVHRARCSQGHRLIPFKTPRLDAWRQKIFSRRTSQTWKWCISCFPETLRPGNNTQECTVSAQQGQRAGRNAWRSWRWLISVTVQGERSNQLCQNHHFRQECMLSSKDNDIWGAPKALQTHSHWNKVCSWHSQRNLRLASFYIGYIHLYILHLFSSEIWHLLPDTSSPFYSNKLSEPWTLWPARYEHIQPTSGPEKLQAEVYKLGTSVGN